MAVAVPGSAQRSRMWRAPSLLLPWPLLLVLALALQPKVEAIKTIHKTLLRHPRGAAGAAGSACAAPGAAPVCTSGSCPSGEVTVQCPPSSADCSSRLQQALNSCCGVVRVPPRGPASAPVHRYVTNTSLCIRSNTKIIFAAGVMIEAGRFAFMDYVAPLFWVAGSTLATSNISNVTIIGHSAVWKMWKEDYDNPALGYIHSEARPGLYMYRCTDCSVVGLTVEASGGDGMEIVGSKRVHIKDVVLDNNYRQGMSVVGVEDMLVEGSVFSNTGRLHGTPPMAGVDVEPDDTGCDVNRCSDATVNLTFRNLARRDCHSADVLSPLLLKHPLLKAEGSAAE